MDRSSRTKTASSLTVAGLVVLLAACSEDEMAEFRRAAMTDSVVTAYWAPGAGAPPSSDVLDETRRDTSWWSAPSVDSVLRTDTLLSLPNDQVAYRPPRESYRIPETWNDLNRLATEDTLRLADPALPAIPAPDSEATAGADENAALVIPVDPFAAMSLPLGGEVEGPSVLYAQILLDRSPFSPGAIDGRWGSNTERSVFWFQRTEGIAPTGQVDSVTLARLYESAGRPGGLLTRYVVTAADVDADYRPIPEDVYQQDTLPCLCYESAAERLAERAHATDDLLAQLNPKVDLTALSAGDTVVVPWAGDLAHGSDPTTAELANGDGRPESAPAIEESETDSIAELIVSDRGRYLHAVDESGNVLYHFPATLGSEYHPSPRQTLEVVSIARDPEFHYQPALLEGVSDTLPATRLPPGPNSLVGVVWIRLSRDHYGIHGTNEPATIGHAHSSGCVRLTNWDASFLADRIRPGVAVRFVDLDG